MACVRIDSAWRGLDMRRDGGGVLTTKSEVCVYLECIIHYYSHYCVVSVCVRVCSLYGVRIKIENRANCFFFKKKRDLVVNGVKSVEDKRER